MNKYVLCFLVLSCCYQLIAQNNQEIQESIPVVNLYLKENPNDLRFSTAARALSKAPPEVFELKSSIPQVLSTAMGNTLAIPANAFIDQNGVPATGKVDVLYKDYYTSLETLADNINMTITANGKTKHFESAGMFELRARKGEKELQLDPSKPIAVNMKSLKQGEGFNYYTYNESTDKWETKQEQLGFEKMESFMIGDTCDLEMLWELVNGSKPRIDIDTYHILYDRENFVFSIKGSTQRSKFRSSNGLSVPISDDEYNFLKSVAYRLDKKSAGKFEKILKRPRGTYLTKADFSKKVRDPKSHLISGDVNDISISYEDPLSSIITLKVITGSDTLVLKSQAAFGLAETAYKNNIAQFYKDYTQVRANRDSIYHNLKAGMDSIMYVYNKYQRYKDKIRNERLFQKGIEVAGRSAVGAFTTNFEISNVGYHNIDRIMASRRSAGRQKTLAPEFYSKGVSVNVKQVTLVSLSTNAIFNFPPDSVDYYQGEKCFWLVTLQDGRVGHVSCSKLAGLDKKNNKPTIHLYEIYEAGKADPKHLMASNMTYLEQTLISN